MMRIILFFLICIFIITLNVHKAISNDCNGLPELVKSVGFSLKIKDNVAIFEQLEKCPQSAVNLLIKELRIIPDPIIKPKEITKYTEALHVIWCIRGLKYLTNGKEFTGKTKIKAKNDRQGYLWQFRTGRNKDELPFFRVWMSRDIIYVAPQDAQVNIIKKWNHWYLSEGEQYNYTSNKSLNDWYF